MKKNTKICSCNPTQRSNIGCFPTDFKNKVRVLTITTFIQFCTGDPNQCHKARKTKIKSRKDELKLSLQKHD